MRRVIIAGGTGFFGRAALELLAGQGIRALAASRRDGAEVQLDVEDGVSLRRTLRQGDIVIDTVGPFQDRSTTLVQAAIEIGFDAIDISDSLAYAQQVFALRDAIAAAGIRVLPSCSSVSAVTAMLVAETGIAEPVRVSGFLVPSARYSASAATADSLLRCIGQSVQVWQDGRFVEARGWLSTRRLSLPPPIGTLDGHLFETTDAFWLPKIWPSLQTVDFYVDSRIPGLNGLFTLSAHRPALRQLISRFQSLGHPFARLLGRKESCLAIEVEAADGSIASQALYCPDRGYRLAVLPAGLASRSIAAETFTGIGLVMPNEQVQPSTLREHEQSLGMKRLHATGTPPGPAFPLA